jgi:hypothetical protein
MNFVVAGNASEGGGSYETNEFRLCFRESERTVREENGDRRKTQRRLENGSEMEETKPVRDGREKE